MGAGMGARLVKFLVKKPLGRVIAVGVLLAGLAIVVMPSAVLAAQVSLSPLSGPPGTLVSVNITNFPPGDEVDTFFGPCGVELLTGTAPLQLSATSSSVRNGLGNIVANSNGIANASATIPSSYQPGINHVGSVSVQPGCYEFTFVPGGGTTTAVIAVGRAQFQVTGATASATQTPTTVCANQDAVIATGICPGGGPGCILTGTVTCSGQQTTPTPQPTTVPTATPTQIPFVCVGGVPGFCNHQPFKRDPNAPPPLIVLVAGTIFPDVLHAEPGGQVVLIPGVTLDANTSSDLLNLAKIDLANHGELETLFATGTCYSPSGRVSSFSSIIGDLQSAGVPKPDPTTEVDFSYSSAASHKLCGKDDAGLYKYTVADTFRSPTDLAKELDDQIRTKLNDYVYDKRPTEVWVFSHSGGGVVASLWAKDYSAKLKDRGFTSKVFTLDSPLAGCTAATNKYCDFAGLYPFTAPAINAYEAFGSNPVDVEYQLPAPRDSNIYMVSYQGDLYVDPIWSMPTTYGGDFQHGLKATEPTCGPLSDLFGWLGLCHGVVFNACSARSWILYSLNLDPTTALSECPSDRSYIPGFIRPL
ncbi:MAG: lipase family protein [Thermomicrobiales bacterium]